MLLRGARGTEQGQSGPRGRRGLPRGGSDGTLEQVDPVAGVNRVDRAAEAESDRSNVDLVLYSPRIPQNVGAVGRLCAVTRTPLHVIRPITFPLDDKALKRSAMDYWKYVSLAVHDSYPACREALAGRRLWLFSTRGERLYTEAPYEPGDVLLFGSEPNGVPDNIRHELAEWTVQIPLFERRTRSLNLAMACAIGLYEAIRQIHSGLGARDKGRGAN